MSRILPDHVAERLRPMPADFAPTIEEQPGYFRWSAQLDVVPTGPMDVELGLSKSGNGTTLAQKKEQLRQSAWQAMELARLGHRSLLSHASVMRHKKT